MGEDHHIAVELIVRSMAQSLGVERAEEVVETALGMHGMRTRRRVTSTECEALLESISEEGGLVRVAASVAKIKLILGTLKH